MRVCVYALVIIALSIPSFLVYNYYHDLYYSNISTINKKYQSKISKINMEKENEISIYNKTYIDQQPKIRYKDIVVHDPTKWIALPPEPTHIINKYTPILEKTIYERDQEKKI